MGVLRISTILRDNIDIIESLEANPRVCDVGVSVNSYQSTIRARIVHGTEITPEGIRTLLSEVCDGAKARLKTWTSSQDDGDDWRFAEASVSRDGGVRVELSGRVK